MPFRSKLLRLPLSPLLDESFRIVITVRRPYDLHAVLSRLLVPPLRSVLTVCIWNFAGLSFVKTTRARQSSLQS